MRAIVPADRELPCPRSRTRRGGRPGRLRQGRRCLQNGGADRGGGRCRGRTPGSQQVTGIPLTACPAARDREGRSRRRGHSCHPEGPGVTGTRGAQAAAPPPSPAPTSAAPHASPARAEFKLRYCPSRKAPTPRLPRAPPLFRPPANREAASLPSPPIRARFIAGWEEALAARARPLWSWSLARSRRVLLLPLPRPLLPALCWCLSRESGGGCGRRRCLSSWRIRRC